MIKKRKTQEQRRRETREAVLNAAVQLLTEADYSRFSAARVATRAGVSRGALERYFPTKNDLLVALTQHVMDTAVADTKLSLAEALAKVGGLLDDRADARAVFLFRYEPVGLVRALGQPIATAAPEGVSPIAYRLDLRDAKSYPLAQEFRVRDKDVIFVANSEGRALYKFFSTLSKVTGPVITGFLTCQATTC